jgi:hypothetical protein
VQIEHKIIIFGGANRNLVHFNDIIVCKRKNYFQWETVVANGDIPSPRSGHAIAKYGKYLILFGGINFTENYAFNDLYYLDTGKLSPFFSESTSLIFLTS